MEIYYIWISKIKGIGPVLSTHLVSYFGDIIKVYNASKEELMKVDGIGEKTANTIIDNKDLSESEIEETFEEQVKALYDQGRSLEEIAKELQTGKTEIELLLKFSGKL